MRSPFYLAVTGVLTACGPQAATGPGNDTQDPVVAEAVPAMPSRNLQRSEPAPPAPGQPGGLADDRTPLSEAPFAKTSAQGAGDVVQTYYALLEARRYEAARRLWGSGGDGRGASAEAFADAFRGYAEYHARVGKPGEIEGAAGSLYVEVPVQIHGREASGKAFSHLATVTLRRVNGVPGATADQLRWHIERVTPAPPGGGGEARAPAGQRRSDRSSPDG